MNPYGLLLVLMLGPLSAQEDFCESPIGMSHLLTPGSATCEVVSGATIVSLSGNTEIEWDTITLTADRELRFVFQDPSHTVVNRSLGTAVTPRITTFIGGRISSNGNVVILAPNNWLQMREDADVEVGSFTAAGLDADAGQFFGASDPLVFEATPDSNASTRVDGRIRTTTGDVLLAGGEELQMTATIDSAGRVTAVTGSRVEIDRSAPRDARTTGGGEIIQGRRIESTADIAFVTQQAISMVGELSPGNGRGKVYVRVDEEGAINIGDAGLTIRGSGEFSTPPAGEIAFIGPVEGDNPAALAPAVNEYPTLRRNRTTAEVRALPSGAGITARVGGGFTRATKVERKKREPGTPLVSAVRKRSFFQTRTTASAARSAE